MAQDPDELVSAWTRLGLSGSPPKVDFTTHVVLGFRRRDECLDTRLRALVLTALGHVRILTLERGGLWTCAVHEHESVLAFAVARAVLPRAFDFTTPEGLTLHVVQRVPESSPRLEWVVRDPAPAPTRIVGHVPKPAPGRPVLARIDDGTPVWVVAHEDGSFDAIDPLEDAPEFCGASGVRRILGYDPASRSFELEWDEYGVNTYAARRNLARYAVAPDREHPDRLVVGEKVAPSRRSVALPARQAVLYVPVQEPEGPRRSVAEARSASDGSTVLLDAALVFGPNGARLCAMDPHAPRPVCPDGAPEPRGVTTSREPHVFGMLGPPVLARVDHGTFADVVWLGTNARCGYDAGLVAARGASSNAASARPASPSELPEKHRFDSWSGTLAPYVTGFYQSGHVLPFGGEAQFGTDYDFSVIDRPDRADAWLDGLFGNDAGAAIRTRVASGSVHGRISTVASVSLATRITNHAGWFRVPTLLTPLAPEAGLLLRSPGPAAFFLGFSAPLDYENYELLPSLVWLPSSREALFGLSIGLVMR